MSRFYKSFLIVSWLFLFGAFSTTSLAQAPPTPVQTFPVDNATTFVTSGQVLTWYPSPWASGLTYNIQVFQGDTTGIKIYDQTQAFSGLNTTIGGLTAGTQYTWRIRSINTSNVVSAWATTTFTVFSTSGGTGTGAPTPIQTWPVDNVTTYLSSQLLSWYPSPFASDLKFTVQVFQGDTNAVMIHNVTAAFTSLNETVSGLFGGVQYTWRVRSINTTTNNVSPWATTTFTTVSTLPPPPPLPTFTIIASSGANGVVTPADTSTVTQGTSKEFVITPNSGYNIKSITVDGSPVTVTSPSGQIFTFTNVTANHTISATFIAAFTITASSGANGTISPSGAVKVDSLGSKTFTFTPNTGYKFATLLVDSSPVPDSTSSYTFSNVVLNHIIFVTFTIIKDTITATAGSGGIISPSGTVLVDFGTDKSFTFTPDDFFAFDSLFVDNVFIDSSTSYTFFNVIANHTIRVVFKADSNLYVEKSGDDLDNGSLTKPYKTIQKALDDIVTNTRAGWTINVGAGTFTEDLVFDGDNTTSPPSSNGNPSAKAPANVILKGTGFLSTTTIKGVSVKDLGAFPAFSANIFIYADGFRLKNFVIESPDVVSGKYSSGIVFSGTNMHFSNLKFLSRITDDESILTQGDGYALVMQSINKSNLSSSDISGIDIHDNIFTSLSAGLGGLDSTGASYEGIYLNPHIGTTSTNTIKIFNNTFEGNCLRAIATQISNLTVTNNTMTTNVATTREGIWVIEGETVSVTGNTVTFFGSGLEFGAQWAGILGPDVIATNNFIADNIDGVFVDADFSSYSGISSGVLTITNNTIKNNTLGMDVSNSIGGIDSTTGFVFLDATNNWWGNTEGPEDATFQIGSTKKELPAGSADSIAAWVNEDPTGFLGNKVVDNTASFKQGGFFVKYYPWDGGIPSITLEDFTTVTGATINMDVDLIAKSASFNTLSGQFNYLPTKLDYLSSSFGTGTLINSFGWSIFFFEAVSGIVKFSAVGATAINTVGQLFGLNFKVVDTSAGSTDVTMTNFLADGSAIFTTTDLGVVTYTFQNAVYTRGDVNLDGLVTIDDALLLQLNITNGTVTSLSALAIQNADADLSGGGITANSTHISLNDVLAILQFILTGNWPVALPIAPPAQIDLANVTVNEQTGLVDLPITIKNAENVHSLDIEFKFDSKVVDYQTFKQYMLTSGNLVNANKVSDGVARFTYATSNNLSGNIEPGKIVFRLLNGIPNSSEITTRYSLNGDSFVDGPKYTIGKVTGIEDNTTIPKDFSLSQNYPNPFNPTTTIRFALPVASFVILKIYNMLGQEVKTLVNAEKNAGTYNVQWRGDNDFGNKVSSGTYIYRVIAGQNIFSKKMILLK